MTLRTKLAAFHARIHSHRHNHGTSTGGGHHHHHHFHLPHLKHKSSKDSKDKSSSSSSSSPSRNPSKSGLSKSTSPSRNPSKRNSLSSTSTTSSTNSTTTTVLNPVLTLIIPTPTHHNHTIEARVYHPPDFPASYGLSQHTPRKAAVIAHPYATLGGTWDDPVVLSLVSLLTRKGWVVATFNFCGAGNSKGKTSWTGNQEREEYATVTSFLVKYVECIDPHTFTISTTTTTSTTIPDISTSTSTQSQPPTKQPIKVLLAGYSYGSLIASRTPSANRILKTIDKDILAYATRTAYEWASTEKRRSFAMVRGAALGRSVWANNDDDDDKEEEEGEEYEGNSTSNRGRGVDEKVNYNVQLETETSWLLVSPILPPVSMFLNIPNPMSWFPTKKRKAEEEEAQKKEHLEDEVEDEREVLAVYGSDDMFTGVGRYRNWTKEKVERSGGKFRGVEVDGAGHFWVQEEEWMVKLREGVARWIDEKSGVGLQL